MKRLILACMLAISLAGCATFDTKVSAVASKVEAVVSAVTGATIDGKTVLIISNVVDGLERTSTNYIKLARCNGLNGPVCRDPVATKAVVAAVRSMRVARNNLQAFMVAHPGQLGPQGLYDAVQASIDTVKSVFAQYNVGA